MLCKGSINLGGWSASVGDGCISAMSEGLFGTVNSSVAGSIKIFVMSRALVNKFYRFHNLYI
jgi:hypothetical protein